MSVQSRDIALLRDSALHVALVSYQMQNARHRQERADKYAKLRAAAAGDQRNGEQRSRPDQSKERQTNAVVESGIASSRESEDEPDGLLVHGGPLGGVEVVGLGENREKLRELTEMHILVLHGTADRIVPVANANQIYAAAGAPESPVADGAARKTLVLVEGAGHNDIAMAEQYFLSIVKFFDQVIPSGR